MAEYRDPLNDPARDPNAGMRDPGLRDPNMGLGRSTSAPEANRGTGRWGWILGAVVVVAVLALVLGWGRGTQTASDTGNAPPSRMSQSAPAPAAPAAPATQPSTTGQGTR